MNPDRLLDDTLASPARERLRSASLAAGRSILRDRRRWRRGRRIAAAAAMLALAATLGWRAVLPPDPSRPTTPRAESQTADFRVITAEELIALFPDRPMAIVGAGDRRTVFFADSPAGP